MFTLHYKGYFKCKSKCQLEFKRNNNKVTVIFTELPDNPGTSITNMISSLASRIVYEYLLEEPIKNIQWIEHFPARGNIEESFDEVHLTWNGIQFSNPKWQRLICPIILSFLKNTQDYFTLADRKLKLKPLQIKTSVSENKCNCIESLITEGSKC